VNQDSPLVLSSGNGNQLSVSDVDAGSDPRIRRSALRLARNADARHDERSQRHRQRHRLGRPHGHARELQHRVERPDLHAHFGLLRFRQPGDHEQRPRRDRLGGAKSDSDNLAITVVHVNHAPVANNDAYSAFA
jgi:hypothetical protein